MKLKYTRAEVSDASEVLHLKLWEGTAFDYSLNGFVTTLTNSPTPAYPGFRFVEGSSQRLTIGTGPTSVKSVSVWVKQDDIAASEPHVTLNGTSWLWCDAGKVTIAGFTAALLYVDGAVAISGTTTIDTEWHHIAVTDTTAENADVCVVGNVAGAYYDGLIDDVRLYSTVRTPAQIKDFYEQTRWRYGV